MFFGATDSNNKIVRNGLLLYLDASQLRSYPGASGITTWYDLSGNNNNFTLTNGPTFSSTNGGSIVFDGTNDYASITSNSTFSVQNLTLSVWVKFNVFGTYNQLIVKPQNGPPWFNPYLSWMLRVNSSNVLEFSIGSSTTYYGSSYTTTFSTGTFYNLVGTYDGFDLRSYINGSSVKVTQLDEAVTINYTSNPVFIAAGYGASPLGEYLNGNLYTVSMYNRALTATEVLNNYTVTKARFGL